MNIQFKKGALELCVLSLLTQKDRYGYELADIISQEINISEGTVYPILRKLKSNDFVETYLEESQDGPPRKYYRLSKKGRIFAKKTESDWVCFIKKISSILKHNKDE